MRYHVPQLGRLRGGRVISKLGSMLHGGIRTTSVERDRHEMDAESDLDSVVHAKNNEELPAECSTRMRDVLRRFVGGVKRRMKSTNEESAGNQDLDGSARDEDPVPDSTIIRSRPAPIIRDDTMDSLTSSSRTRSVSFNAVVKAMPIETRQQRYGDVASKRAAFYSQSDVAAFKKSLVRTVHTKKRASVSGNQAWYWQTETSTLEAEEDYNTFDYTWCKLPESRVDSHSDVRLLATPPPPRRRQEITQAQDFSRWVWQERPRRPVSPRGRVQRTPV